MHVTEMEHGYETKGLDADEMLYEVVNGQRKEYERMGAYETTLASVLLLYMGSFALERKFGIVVTETLFILDAAGDLRRRPDLAFVSYDRWPDAMVPRVPAWNVVPHLAVEIISPTNLAEEGKLVEYFSAGVHLVWVIYPDTARVHVWRSAHQNEVLERSGTLDGGDVLPGFQLPIESLFAALRKPNVTS